MRPYVYMFVVGFIIGAMMIGSAWKYSVVSGDYFSIGPVFYYCQAAVLHDK